MDAALIVKALEYVSFSGRMLETFIHVRREVLIFNSCDEKFT